MRFSSSIVIGGFAALAAAVPQATTSAATPANTQPVSGAANAITYPLGDEPIVAGKPITIKWQPNFGEKVTLSLRKGDDPDNLDNLMDIAADVDNSGTLTWTPPKDLEAGSDYAIEIVSGQSANYSPQFEVDSNGSGLTTTKSSAFTATTDSASGTKTASTSKSTSTGSRSATRTSSASDEDASSEPTASADASADASSDASSSPSGTSEPSASVTDITAAADTAAADNGAGQIARSPLALMVGLVAVLALFH